MIKNINIGQELEPFRMAGAAMDTTAWRAVA